MFIRSTMLYAHYIKHDGTNPMWLAVFFKQQRPYRGIQPFGHKHIQTIQPAFRIVGLCLCDLLEVRIAAQALKQEQPNVGEETVHVPFYGEAGESATGHTIEWL
jgi:hypothetical protein